MNPWRVLTEVAKPNDYVIVKLDIDHQATELALVKQILEQKPNNISSLIDELFWEHHVYGSAMCCPTLSGQKNGSVWSKMVFNRTKGSLESLKESYEMFSSP